jgi:hypothetical protein
MPKPPNIGAVVAVDAAGAPKILVVVDVGAPEPKPVNAGVLIVEPNAGAAALVAVPNMFVVVGCVPNGFVIAGAAADVEVGTPNIFVVAVGAVAPKGVLVAGWENRLVVAVG